MFTNNINRTVFYLDIKYNPFAENSFKLIHVRDLDIFILI